MEWHDHEKVLYKELSFFQEVGIPQKEVTLELLQKITQSAFKA